VRYREKLAPLGHKLPRYKLAALYAAICFPVIDYLVRNVLQLGPIASLWDQLLLGYFLLLLVAREHDRPGRLQPGTVLPSVYPLAALCCVYLVADLNNFLVTVEGIRATVQFIPFFFVGYLLIDDSDQALSLLRTAAAVAAAVAAVGLLQAVVGVQMPSGWIDVTETVSVRIYSIVQSPNVLGSHMSLGIFLATGLTLYESSRRNKILWAAASLIMLAALVLTYSRGAWLAFAAAALMAAYFWDRRLLLAGLMICLAVAILLPSISTRVLAVVSEQYLEKSLQAGRLGRWLDAYDQLRLNPLFGRGPGRHGGAVAARAFGTPYADNYYVKLAAELGLIGLGVYLLWLGRTLLEGFRSWMHVRCDRRFYLLGGLLGGLVAVALHNGVENIFEVPYLNCYFWLLAGLLAAYPHLPNSPSKEGG